MGSVEGFVEELSARAQRDRLPELFLRPGALYRQQNRRGVSTVAIRQQDVTTAELRAVLRYRLANAVLNGDVDPEPIAERRAEAEWWFTGSPHDVHLLVGSSDTGAIMAYLALAFVEGADEASTVMTEDRPRFEVEDVFGWQVYHRVARLPTIPVRRIAEMRRFSRAHWLPPFAELAVRAPLELCCTLVHVMLGPLRAQVDALVGAVEADKAQRNIDYFGMPSTRLTGAIPSGEAPPYPGAVRHVEGYPVVLWTEDFAEIEPRVSAVEAALEEPWSFARRRLFGEQPGTSRRTINA